MAIEDITLPIADIVKNNITINDYLILYNIANGFVISGLLDTSLETLTKLEKKGYIKIAPDGLHLREMSSAFFVVNEDLFSVWLRAYPTSVKKRFGGNRALSPASPNTILGKKLKQKWDRIFKKDIKKQQLAIKVLELEVKDKTRSGDLEYMVEAARWLNEGYHEKYSYLLDEERASSQYDNEDYM